MLRDASLRRCQGPSALGGVVVMVTGEGLVQGVPRPVARLVRQVNAGPRRSPHFRVSRSGIHAIAGRPEGRKLRRRRTKARRAAGTQGRVPPYVYTKSLILLRGLIGVLRP